MPYNHGPMTLCDRWALIEVVLDLRVRLVKLGGWPRQAMVAWREREEAGLMAFAVGMRWAELDGYVAPFGDHRSREGTIPMPTLINDLPVLAEAFSAGYRTMMSGVADKPRPTSAERLLLSVFQAATYLGRTEHEVLMLMNDGVLACQWFGGERRVSFKDLESYRIRDASDEARAVEALMTVAELIAQESAIRVA
jgi:hypothetical protein